MDGSMFWAEFLLVSRLYNPALPITALVDHLSETAGSRAGAALQQAGITLTATQPFSGPESRGARLMASAGPFFQRYFSMFEPGHACASNESTSSPLCQRTASGRMSMLARFCWQVRHFHHGVVLDWPFCWHAVLSTHAGNALPLLAQ